MINSITAVPAKTITYNEKVLLPLFFTMAYNTVLVLGFKNP